MSTTERDDADRYATAVDHLLATDPPAPPEGYRPPAVPELLRAQRRRRATSAYRSPH